MDSRNVNLLLIEDNEDDALLIRETLGEVKDAPFALEWVDRLSTAFARLDEGGI